jgi:hypothetical protein
MELVASGSQDEETPSIPSIYVPCMGFPTYIPQYSTVTSMNHLFVAIFDRKVYCCNDKTCELHIDKFNRAVSTLCDILRFRRVSSHSEETGWFKLPMWNLRSYSFQHETVSRSPTANYSFYQSILLQSVSKFHVIINHSLLLSLEMYCNEVKRKLLQAASITENFHMHLQSFNFICIK